MPEFLNGIELNPEAAERTSQLPQAEARWEAYAAAKTWDACRDIRNA